MRQRGTRKYIGYLLGCLLMLVMLAGCGNIEWFPSTPAALTIVTTTLPAATIGTKYSAVIAITGGKSPYTFTVSSGSLPAGLTMSSIGVISGTPTASAVDSPFTVTVTDSSSPAVSVSQQLTIKTSLAISTTTLPAGTINTAYRQQVIASGGTLGYTFSISSGVLPAGLTIDATTGVISGTPTGPAGTATFTVTVTDSASTPATVSQQLSITISTPPLTITTTSLSDGIINTEYNKTTVVVTGGTTPYRFAVSSGTLPTGLTLNTSTGEIAGTPTGPVGSSSFTVTVTDSAGTPSSVSQPLTITVSETAPLAITTTSLPPGYISKNYSQTVVATGGKPAYKFSVSSGSLPAGLSLNASTGVISGTPTGLAGPVSFTVTVTDSAATPASVPKPLTITIGLLGGAIQGNNLALTNTVSTFAGLAGTSGSANGTGTNARFYNPMGITTDGVSLFVADYANNTIRQIVIATGAVATLAGDAAAAPDSIDGIGSAARFNYPRGITTDGTNLYVTDSFSHTIRKIVIATAEVTTIAGSKDNPGYTNGSGTAAQFSSPYGITTDGTNLYVADSGNAAIRKIDLATMNVTTLAGDSLGTFSVPAGITTDGTNLYVADNGFNVIFKVDTTGTVTQFAGSGNTGSADGTGTAAEFFSPTGITTDGFNLYVVDQLNFTIRKIVISTAEVTTIAGTVGTPGADDGPGSTATFNFPSDITTDGSSLFIIDSDNHTVRRIQ